MNVGTQKQEKSKSNDPNKENMQQICEQHERLIEIILSEEEDLIGTHRNYVDRNAENIKLEMGLLQCVDQPNSDVNEYVIKLNSLLSQKANDIAILRGKLRQFSEHLQQEKTISAEFQHLSSTDDNLLEMMIDS